MGARAYIHGMLPLLGCCTAPGGPVRGKGTWLENLVPLVTVKAFERRTPPFISLAFISYAVSLAAPPFSNLDVATRLFTAVFLALSVAYGSEKAK